MTLDRRDFVKTTAAAAAAAWLPVTSPAATLELPQADASIKDLCMRALDAAKAAGASYADVRVSRNRNQAVSTRERQLTGLRDSETFGFGVRVLVNGAWGFAASRDVTAAEVTRVARAAATQARANRIAVRKPVELAPIDPVPDGRWQSPIETDPFTIPIEDKVALLLRANEEALKVAGARFVSSSLFFVREEKTYASTDGVFTVQTIYRGQPSMNVTAVSADRGDFQTRNSAEVPPAGLGWEHVLRADLPTQAAKWAEEAVRKLTAKSVEPGRYDLVLHPSHLWLTIHESIGHPTELDRALWFEANYAGTSFLAPPERVLGKVKYGPEFMQIQGDRTQRGSLSAIGWDDDGVPAQAFPLIKDGMFVDYQTTRDQVAWIKNLTGVERSHGCSYAESWADVQFQRMPNVSLLPGADTKSVDDLIAATDRGIFIVGDGSYSIDQQRYNFQFGGQVFYEIQGGKITGMLKDVAYQSRTVDFWNSMDLIGGPATYQVLGAFNDGKGQPGQSNAVSHGCPVARFKGVNVINTRR
jgi:TldD protein